MGAPLPREGHGEVFASDWEQHPNLDDCLHAWEPVAYLKRDGSVAHVDRCRNCGSPRCVRPGCIERLHHRTVHIMTDGSFEPVGGYLAPSTPTPTTEGDN